MDPNVIRKLLDEQDWSDVFARLVVFAESRCRSKALAKDLAQTAITRVYGYESKWDPAKDPDVTVYLMGVVNMLLYNERRTPGARRNVTMDDRKRPAVREMAEAVADTQAFSEDRAGAHDLLSRRTALLQERLAGDPEVLVVLGHTIDGNDTPADLARLTTWSAAKVNRVRLRLLRAAAKVARDLGGDCDGALLQMANHPDEDDETAS